MGEAFGEQIWTDRKGKIDKCVTWKPVNREYYPGSILDTKYFNPVAISARCCASAKGSAVLAGESVNFHDSDGVNCLKADGGCNSVESVHVGCAGNYAMPSRWNGGFARKQLGTRHDETGCHTGRIDKGKVIAADICIEAKGKGEKKVIDCFDVTSETAELNAITQRFESIAMCPESYEIVDCNSFVTELAECDSSGDAVSLGGYYGANRAECIAVADNNHVRAQASCCRLEL